LFNGNNASEYGTLENIYYAQMQWYF